MAGKLLLGLRLKQITMTARTVNLFLLRNLLIVWLVMCTSVRYIGGSDLLDVVSS
uniref:Uncharacterized protein n=1 Tax=Lotus japonicus TaxID=34305 RepID=I3SNV8_LOTJA|nr:unknown [Lotus japonicus]